MFHLHFSHIYSSICIINNSVSLVGLLSSAVGNMCVVIIGHGMMIISSEVILGF
jgi:hypothetical protein